MTSRRLISLVAVLTVFTALTLAQQQEAGTVDYSLANSSVMWIPSSTSIFLNPGELARLHQNEFTISSGRFKSLESMSSAVFVPGTGTFGIGVTPYSNSTQYSIGFGRLLGNYNIVGGALSVLPNVERSVRFSLGGSLHFPVVGEESGGHAGLSVSNIVSKAVLRAGGGYWLMPKALRLQVATQTGLVGAELLGLEAKVLEGLHVQVGTRGFKRLLGGVSYALPYATVSLGAGPEGLSFTMKARIGDAAADLREEAYDQGNEALADQRFADARESFLNALRYDEYDNEVRLLAEKSRLLMDSSVTALLQQANENEEQHNYPEAMRAYAQILKIDPHQTVAAADLASVEQKLRLYVQRLLVAGDSLKELHDLTRARKSYDLALELDPENDSASVRIDELENLSKENIRSMLVRARSLLRKNQLDDSQKEFERILSLEPTNAQALSGLRAVSTRRINDQLTLGKAAYDGRKYLEALQMFSDIVQREVNNKEAKLYLEKTRMALRSDVERLFKSGLQFYIKEDFKSAIAAWDKVLMIQPEDSSTREYRTRAEEKLKALEQFK